MELQYPHMGPAQLLAKLEGKTGAGVITSIDKICDVLLE